MQPLFNRQFSSWLLCFPIKGYQEVVGKATHVEHFSWIIISSLQITICMLGLLLKLGVHRNFRCQ